MRFNCDASYTDLNNFPMEFTTDVDGEPEMVHGGAVVHYSVNVDVGKSGIKDITANVSIIEISIGDYELCVKQFSPATIDGNNDDEWEVEEHIDLTNRQVYPDRVELDWERKQAFIYFK